MQQITSEFDHKSVPIYVSKYSTVRGSEGVRAFCSAGNAREWILDQIERDYELDEWDLDKEKEAWCIDETDCQASVRKISFHNPGFLQHIHPEVFE